MVPEPEEDRVGVGQGRLCVCRGGMLGTGAGDRLDTSRPARRQRGLVAHRDGSPEAEEPRQEAAVRLGVAGVSLTRTRVEACSAGGRAATAAHGGRRLRACMD
eukprot:scaffold65442_cov61-Phaeocystis_antarctica.AAC.3